MEEIGFMDDPNFSRNASSSRAIPVERLIKDVLDDPAMPVSWGKNRRGMQAEEELSVEYRGYAELLWFKARHYAVQQAREMAGLGLHKQIVNRVIEPWCHINVVATFTELDNFYALRRHPDADPTMQALANAMWDAEQASTPKLLRPGEWHLPYVADGYELDIGRKVSVARCARVSYLTHDGRRTTVDEDLELYERLLGSAPLHASPAEHQATPDRKRGTSWIGKGWWAHPELHGNLVGWVQYRKTFRTRTSGAIAPDVG